MARLPVRLFGPLQVLLDGEPVSGFRSDKVRALLAYLCVEAGEPHRRERLAGLLWPDLPERPARAGLRNALSNLRTVIGDHARSRGDARPDELHTAPRILHITRQTIQFNSASDSQVDVIALNGLLQAAAASLSMSQTPQKQTLDGLDEAVALYRGGFLEGFSLPGCPAFEEWALLQRERFHRLVADALDTLTDGYIERGDLQAGLRLAWRQVELDPWRERAHRRVMRLLALTGQRGAALAQYHVCQRILAEELGAEPAEATGALYRQIRDGALNGQRSPLALSADHVRQQPAFLSQAEPTATERPTFVSRSSELAALDGYLDLALLARGHVIFTTGEAGSGKTALIGEFVRRAQDAHADLVVASGSCNAHTGFGDPYLPFREVLALLTGAVETRWAAGAVTSDHARRLWNTLPVAAQALLEAGPDLLDTFLPGRPLLSRAVAYTQRRRGASRLRRLERLVELRGLRQVSDIPVRAATAAARQSDLLEQYTQVLLALARQVPVVLVLDDLQWADTGSVNLLFHLGRQIGGSRILVVGAYRPEEIAVGRAGERHPLESVVNEFQLLFGDSRVDLDRADGRPFVEAFLDAEPNRLGAPFREMLYHRTRGHPLFTGELLRAMKERGDLVQDQAGRWIEGSALDWQMAPKRVEAAVAERIGRLPQPLKRALAVASVEGEIFTAELVAGVLGVDEGEMVTCLSAEIDRRYRLIRAVGIEYLGSRRLSSYRFRHYLFQQYLYNHLDSVERAHLHGTVGVVLENLHGGGEPEIKAIAPTLARHFREAGETEKAIHYLHQAGETALQLSGYREAEEHLTDALALLATWPEPGGQERRSERDRQELALQVSLGKALVGTKGSAAPEVERAFARARELCQETGQTSQLCRVLDKLSVRHYVRAEHQTARQLGEDALSLAQQAGDPLLVAAGHRCLGFICFSLGEYRTARDHLEQMISLYEPEQHHRAFVLLRGSDAGTSALAYYACCLWCLGYPNQAMERSQEALALARDLGHPFSRADVLYYAGCMFDELRREPLSLQRHADELIRLSQENGFPTWLASGTFFQGEALALSGQVREGVEQMQKSISELRSLGSRCHLTGALGALAQAHAAAGRQEEGLSTVADALCLVQQTGERHWEPELHRLRGELLLSLGDDIAAEGSLDTAIAVARKQRAKSWELRTATSLARLWRKQGRVDKARQLLSQVYGWFAEGFDTRDLQEAGELLEQLS